MKEYLLSPNCSYYAECPKAKENTDIRHKLDEEVLFSKKNLEEKGAFTELAIVKDKISGMKYVKVQVGNVYDIKLTSSLNSFDPNCRPNRLYKNDEGESATIFLFSFECGPLTSPENSVASWVRKKATKTPSIVPLSEFARVLKLSEKGKSTFVDDFLKEYKTSQQQLFETGMTLSITSTRPGTQPKDPHSPFGKLPNEIITSIIEYVTSNELSRKALHAGYAYGSSLLKFLPNSQLKKPNSKNNITPSRLPTKSASFHGQPAPTQKAVLNPNQTNQPVTREEETRQAPGTDPVKRKLLPHKQTAPVSQQKSEAKKETPKPFASNSLGSGKGKVVSTWLKKQETDPDKPEKKLPLTTKQRSPSFTGGRAELFKKLNGDPPTRQS